LSYLLLFLSTILVILNTAVVSMIMVACAIAKWLIPILASQRFFSKMANQIMWCWATINKFLLTLFNNVEWQVTGNESLNKESWYLLMSNHISWTDIVVLSSSFKDSMPMTKFFVKKQLLFVPFVGLACWALDMPFMRRYSSQYLLKQPLKQQQTDSPYQYLLKPKAGGIAYTLAAMGEQFDCILDVTLAYPQNRETPFKDLLMGKMKKIVVQINVIEITAEVQGDYFNDPIYKQQFQQWLSQVWQKKDQRLAEIYKKN